MAISRRARKPELETYVTFGIFIIVGLFSSSLTISSRVESDVATSICPSNEIIFMLSLRSTVTVINFTSRFGNTHRRINIAVNNRVDNARLVKCQSFGEGGVKFCGVANLPTFSPARFGVLDIVGIFYVHIGVLAKIRQQKFFDNVKFAVVENYVDDGNFIFDAS